MGLALSAGDFEMARSNRDIAQYWGKFLSGWEQQTRFGGEWGLRHYMLKQGFRQFLSTGDDFAAGQFILSPKEATPYAVPQDVDSMLVPVRHQSWQSSIPIRLMNRQAHAGFYSSSWGLLPFSFSYAPLEEITLRQVSDLVEKLPEITLEGARDEAIIPSPASGGGVDVSIPVPSRVAIPYDVSLPMRVQFSCISTPEPGKCPIRVLYDHDGTQSEAALEQVDSSSSDQLMYFELPRLSPGTIVLDTTMPGIPANAHRVTIRNWFLLPSGGAH